MTALHPPTRCAHRLSIAVLQTYRCVQCPGTCCLIAAVTCSLQGRCSCMLAPHRSASAHGDLAASLDAFRNRRKSQHLVLSPTILTSSRKRSRCNGSFNGEKSASKRVFPRSNLAETVFTSLVLMGLKVENRACPFELDGHSNFQK